MLSRVMDVQFPYTMKVSTKTGYKMEADRPQTRHHECTIAPPHYDMTFSSFLASSYAGVFTVLENPIGGDRNWLDSRSGCIFVPTVSIGTSS